LPKRWVFKKSISLTYPFADARIAVSAGVADDLATFAGLPRGNISVVYNPLFQRPASPDDFATAEAIWGGWSGPRVLTVGNLDPRKNHPLDRAFEKVVKADAGLLILGRDQGTEGIVKAYARSLGADKVIIPGAVESAA
jgi:glycosyltransferase involved in cell wall biosynthesis